MINVEIKELYGDRREWGVKCYTDSLEVAAERGCKKIYGRSVVFIKNEELSTGTVLYGQPFRRIRGNSHSYTSVAGLIQITED